MKKALLAGLMVSLFSCGMIGCSDDDSAPSSEDMCKLFAKDNGDISQTLDFGTIPDSRKDDAVKICVDEIDNLPKCKDEYMALFTCEYEQGNKGDKCQSEKEAKSKCYNNDANNDALSAYEAEYNAKYQALKN